MEGREGEREDEQVGRGQKENGEMIKYCAVSLSRPISARAPFPSALAPNFCLSSRRYAWRQRTQKSEQGFESSPRNEQSSPARIAFSPNAQHFLSLSFCPPCRKRITGIGLARGRPPTPAGLQKKTNSDTTAFLTSTSDVSSQVRSTSDNLSTYISLYT